MKLGPWVSNDALFRRFEGHNKKVENTGLCCKISLPPGRCNDLVCARQIGEAAVLGAEIHAVRSSGAGQGETLQNGHQEEEDLHASEGLSDTSSLS